MLDRTGLARKTAAANGGDDVVLALAIGDGEGLVDDQAQRRTCEIHFLVLAVDDDLAAAGLQPHASGGVLAATGCVGAAFLVEFLLAQGNVGGSSDIGGIALRRVTGDVLQIGEIRDGFVLGFVGHYATTLFLRFIEATSSFSGFWPS